jgi:Fe-S-cluster-containing hydrogenase component 2
MGHRTVKSGYQQLSDRLNKFPQGAPPSEYLFSILKVLMKEKEAQTLSQLPIKPFSAASAAKILHRPLPETTEILDELASRALLVDMMKPDGETMYMLPPPMAGFFEFSLMRVRTDIDQKVLAELFYQYLNVEEDFVRDLFVEGETKLTKVFVNEDAIAKSQELFILDYERASNMIKQASHLGVGICYCRHKMEHMGKACDAPMEICMTLGNVAESLIRHGHARQVTVKETMALLEKAWDHNLVQIAENQQDDIPFICNCCGCCCEALLAVQRFGTMNSINTTNFLPVLEPERCTGCKLCITACPVNAISLENGKAVIDQDVCLGCGVCVRACHTGAMKLKARDQRVITPVNSVHRVALMAIERGSLQNLIFDNQAYMSHRAMAALFGAVLKLPPVKRVMASEQVRSKYLLSIIDSYQKKGRI